MKSIGSKPTDGVLLCLVDHPLITSALVDELIETFYSTGKFDCRSNISRQARTSGNFRVQIISMNFWKRRKKLERAPSFGNMRVKFIEVPTGEEGIVLNLNDPETFRSATAED